MSRNALLLIFFCVSVISFTPRQNKEYVCLPCGYDCDKEIHTSPGTCHGCGMSLIDKSTIRFGDISVDAFCSRIASNPNAVLLDVRTPGEFNGTNTEVPSFGHFKNAININVEELERRLGELEKYKDKEVLVYCSHSHRSPRASYFLSTHGFKQVANMSGGVSTFVGKQDIDCLKKYFLFHKF